MLGIGLIMVYILTSLFLVMIMHEVFHLIGGKIMKLKIKLFGIAIFGAFSGVDLKNATNKQKAFVYLSGPIFSLIFISLPIYYIIYFSLIPLSLQVYTLLFFTLWLGVFINLYNLIPMIKGNDIFNALALKISEDKLNYIVLITNIAFVIWLLLYGIEYAIIYSVIVIALFYFIGDLSKIEVDDEVESGFHILRIQNKKKTPIGIFIAF